MLYSLDQLTRVLVQAAVFDNSCFQVRLFLRPPEVIPAIHIMSFDNKDIFVGGFYGGQAPDETFALKVEHGEFTRLAKNYWKQLWATAKPLNGSGEEIDWEVAGEAAAFLGFSGDIRSLQDQVSQSANAKREYLESEDSRGLLATFFTYFPFKK